MEDFIHLHVHTHYSILDGMSKIPELVDKAVGNGMRGMALTDHGNMFGVKEFFDYANGVNKKLKKEGKEPFKPIFGCEMYVARHRLEDKVKEHGDMSGYHLIVLAKNNWLLPGRISVSEANIWILKTGAWESSTTFGADGLLSFTAFLFTVFRSLTVFNLPVVPCLSSWSSCLYSSGTIFGISGTCFVAVL